MTPVALTLFDPPPAPPKAPPNADQQHVLAALTLGPGNAYALQTRMAGEGVHREINAIGTRLRELEKLGLAVRTGEKRPGYSPRKQHVWRLA